MLSPSYMIEEDDLCILFAFDLYSLGTVTWWILGWVDVYHFSISFVSEQQSLVRVGVDSEVGRVIQGWMLSIPVEEAEVRLLWHEHLLSLKDLPKVLSFQPVSKINVARDLVLPFSRVSNEDNRGHPSTSDIVFSVSQRLQEI